MKELGITKGEYNISKRRRKMNQLRSYGIEIDIGTEYKEAITVWAGDDPQDKTANITAELITDSLNTAQKCGLLPSELLRQRDELREALLYLMDGVRGLPPLTAIVGVLEQQYIQAEAAIKNTADSCR